MTSGTIYTRKKKGRKYTFICGGPTLEQAPTYIRWENIDANTMVFWGSHDGSEMVEVKRPS